MFFLLKPALRGTLLLTGLAAACVPLCPAQQIVLRDGRTVPAQGLKRDGNTLLGSIEVAGQVGQTGYAVSSIDHLELPRPPAMLQAEQSVATGKYAQALAEIDPVVASQYPFRDIKGNYWAQAVLIKTSAQIGAGKTADASALLTQLSLFNIDPSAALTAKARLASMLAQGGKEKSAAALLLADQIIFASEDRGVLSDAYLAKGRALLAQDKYGDALLAFLNLPVFYDQQPSNTAAAMLGSARCYMAMGDTRRGVRTFVELEEHFPSLPEAATAKAEIEKGGERLASLATEAKNQESESDKQFKGEPEK